MSEPVEHIRWRGGRLILLDQTLLPNREKYITLRTVEQIWEAIHQLRVRGAPAIGVAAGYGMYVGLRKSAGCTYVSFLKKANRVGKYLSSSRPTAVNLQWAVDRMIRLVRTNHTQPVPSILKAMLDEAHRILSEDHEMCLSIGQHGARILKQGHTVLTHCNAGGLATGRYGTALAPIYEAHRRGLKIAVYADETRPLLQGARLTAYELQKAGIPVTVICDNMAATVMRMGRIDVVIVGADRIALNGDFANKIGTYSVALSAHEHGIPFYCAAPSSTFDRKSKKGADIPIEERSPLEIESMFGPRTVPRGVKVFNPAFDVTPARLVAGFITEKGILSAPYPRSIRRFLAERC